MMGKQIKKLIILNLPYLLIGFAFTNVGEAWRLAFGGTISEKVQSLVLDGIFPQAFSNPMPSFHPFDVLIGMAFAAILKMIVYLKGKNAKKFRQNEEYGSARWVA